MSAHRRIILLILIMTVVTASMSVIAIKILYDTAFEQQCARLVETAQSQARLMEAVARFDRNHSGDSPAGAQAASIAQIVDAQEHYQGFGDTGEFTLAKRADDHIVFILRHRHFDLDKPEPVPFASVLAEPMRRALSGLSGTVIGPDYRGVTVLAAHEPVAVLELGIVAKIDLAEIRAPFIKAGSMVGGIALILILTATMLFFRVGTPIMQRARESEQRLKTIIDSLTSIVFLKDVQGRYLLINPQHGVATGLAESEVLGKTDHDFLPKAVADRLRKADLNALTTGKSVQTEETMPGPKGMRHYVTTRVPVKDEAARYYGLFGIATDITDRMRAEEALKARVQQQAAVAELGRRALAGTDLDTLFKDAVDQTALGLGVEYAKVLELLPDGNRMRLRAGVGWQAGYVGKATVSADRDSQAGFTLLSEEPVIVEDLRTETRFTGPPLLHEHGVVSGMSVIIQGKDKPFGVFGAHTCKRHPFSADDINFLRAVANVLAETLERDRAEEALQRAHDELETRVKERTADLVATNRSLQQEIIARQEAEEALRASEQRYAKAAEIADFGYWERDIGQDTTIWSDEAYRIFGVDAEHLDGTDDSFRRMVHPADREPLKRAMDAALSQGKALDTEYRLTRGDGNERIIHSVAEARLDPSGRLLGQHGVVHDITERKHAELELRRSLRDQEVIASILRISLRPIPLAEMLAQTLNLVLTKHELLLETQGCIFLVEGEGKELVMQVKQGLPDSILETCHRLPVGRCVCGRAAEQGELLHTSALDQRHELRYTQMSPHGHYCAPIQSEGEVLGVLNLYVPEGHQSSETEEAFVTAVADTLAGIIRRKRAEETLAETQSEYEDLYDNAPDMFASVDATTGTITQCNRTLADALGYAKEELVGHSVLDLYDPDCLPGDDNALEAFTGMGQVRDAELRLRRKDGSKIDVSLNVTAVRDDASRILYSRAAWRDITERKLVEQKAREHEAQLAHVARLSTVGEMTTGIAHEINQPLTAMVTYAQACLRMMESGKADTDRLRGAFLQVSAQGLRAGEIIRRLKGFTRMRETKRKPVSINKLVSEAVRFVEAEARETDIEIILDLARRLPDVVADTIQIEQVILNLLRNAIDAMEDIDGPRVLSVKTGRTRDGKVELVASDTGPGLAKESMSRIFEPFVTTKRQGMGMGLSISRSIVEAHRGHLWADEPGAGGATFRFMLPAAVKEKKKENVIEH